MPAYHYRITVDRLHSSTCEGGLQSLSFFAAHHSDIFTTASSLRHRLDLSACDATKLALAISLINQVGIELCDLPFLPELTLDA